MKATGTATWTGNWKNGQGSISTTSATIKDAKYTFSSRFIGAEGASPEELLAAGHAGCFNQALANNFGMHGFVASNIETSVTLDLNLDEADHPSIGASQIIVEATVPEISQELFEECAERSRANCTISRILKIDIKMKATLVP